MGTNWRRTVPTLPIEHLLTDLRFAGFWAVVRVLVGWTWLQAGWRLAQDAAWMNGDRLTCLGPSGGAGATPLAWQLVCQGGDPAWVEGAAGAWGARAVAIAVTLIGIAVILGCLTGPAILLGGLAVLVAMPPPALAGVVLQLGAVVGLVAARRSAGWIGLDRWLLPMLAKWRRHQPLP